MSLELRRGTVDDAPACGVIAYEAFRAISERHAFPPDFPSAEVATELLVSFLTRADVYSVVAEDEGRIVGSNFLSEGCAVAGVGPITVDPTSQDAAVGRRLMENVLERARWKRFAGVRLVQAAYHCRSLSLYTKLGFVVREPIVNLQGPAIGERVGGYSVRPAIQDDLEACDDLCRKIHGHDRSAEVIDAIVRGSATVVERGGRITGYATAVAFFGHSVGETNDDLAALISAASEFGGPGFLLPARNHELFRWCLERGLRVVQTLNLMSIGLYNEPRGAYLPSVLF